MNRYGLGDPSTTQREHTRMADSTDAPSDVPEEKTSGASDGVSGKLDGAADRLAAMADRLRSRGPRPRAKQNVQPAAGTSAEVPDLDADHGHPDRAGVIGDGVRWTANWALRLSIILLTLWLVKQALGPLWIAILPILLGLVISTVLWPPTRWLRNKGLPPAAAAAISVLGGLTLIVGAMTALGSSVAAQAPDLAKQATQGVRKVQEWAQGEPLNLKATDIDKAVSQLTDKLSESATQIAGGVVGGITSTVQVFVTILLALLLSFFFVKDGPRFAPWVRRVTGDETGGHLTEVFARMWNTLGGYVRGQALVSLIDAVFIGAGLAVLGVPLWLPLAAVTFFGGFIPIVGATVAGGLAVLVALVSTSVTKALLVLLLVIIVQQLEGNVLQPMIQSKSMNLHAGLVILSVTVGSSMYGIIGAFLAVPAAALLVVLMRYLQEQIDLRSGTSTPDELTYATKEGRLAADLTTLRSQQSSE